MSKLFDVRGVEVEVGDTVGICYLDYDKNKPSLEVAIVEGINPKANSVFLDDGEPIPLDKFDVIVLPEGYEVW